MLLETLHCSNKPWYDKTAATRTANAERVIGTRGVGAAITRAAAAAERKRPLGSRCRGVLCTHVSPALDVMLLLLMYVPS